MTQKQILIVEDEFNTRYAIDFALSNAGYETLQAKDGHEALRLINERAAAQHPFDLVVTDIQMPGITGIELIDCIKQGTMNLPVLVITGFGDKKTLIELLRRSCDDYLDKPFTPEELLKAVERVLDKYGKSKTGQIIEGLHEKLLTSEKMSVMGQIASKIAHEINNPAQVIQGFAEMLLEDGAMDQKTKKMASYIYEAVQSITKLNRDMMDLARPRETHITEFHPEEPIEKAIEFLQEAGVAKHCRIVREYQQNLPMIRGDMMQLNQVFLNLIVNACYAMKDAEEKILSVSLIHVHESNRISVSISDTGCGISEENLNKIFESFFTTRASDGGTGLGLAVVKHIVESHNGTIRVESKIGSGTTFTISMPVSTIQ